MLIKNKLREKSLKDKFPNKFRKELGKEIKKEEKEVVVVTSKKTKKQK